MIRVSRRAKTERGRVESTLACSLVRAQMARAAGDPGANGHVTGHGNFHSEGSDQGWLAVLGLALCLIVGVLVFRWLVRVLLVWVRRAVARVWAVLSFPFVLVSGLFRSFGCACRCVCGCGRRVVGGEVQAPAVRGKARGYGFRRGGPRERAKALGYDRPPR